MIFRASTVPTVVSFGAMALLGLGGMGMSSQQPEVRAQASCFVVGANVACIDAGYVPVVPGPPVMTVITGPASTGDHEDTVIRDDGGHEVARG